MCNPEYTMKFKKGDKITAIQKGMGLEDAVVTGTLKQNGKQYYKLKIPCGTALLPTCAEPNYKIIEDGD